MLRHLGHLISGPLTEKEQSRLSVIVHRNGRLSPNELALAQACQYFASSPGLPSSLPRFSSGAVAFTAITFKKDKDLADDKEVYATRIAIERDIGAA